MPVNAGVLEPATSRFFPLCGATAYSDGMGNEVIIIVLVATVVAAILGAVVYGVTGAIIGAGIIFGLALLAASNF